ncbi:MAG: helix-turn-helix transcriptional regulator [Angelakisella sp.]
MATIFGERLRHLRKARGLTQKKLSGLLLVSQTSINRYELGADEPGYDKLVRLSRLLETTTDFLLGLTDCEQIPTTPVAYLTPQEWELVNHFRRLPLRGRERALGYLQGAAENK